MRYILITSTLLICLFILGCGFIHDKHITGKYRLIAVDTDEQMNISYDLGGGTTIERIGETVFAYGFDQRYIVAQQHPNNNLRITNYYYLDMSKDSEAADPSDSVIGPLSQEDFDLASKQLNLPKISYVINQLK